MAIRLGLTLPQARQYDIGRDVPDVARTADPGVGSQSVRVRQVLRPPPRVDLVARELRDVADRFGLPGLPARVAAGAVVQEFGGV